MLRDNVTKLRLQPFKMRDIQKDIGEDMIATVVYLLLFLGGLAFTFACDAQGYFPAWVVTYRTAIHCVITGGMGGCLYCLRGVYLNACVKRNWDSVWLPWYFLRPIASSISGLVSYIFMQAGLLILDSKSQQAASEVGYVAFAFIAGLNVDKFLEKIESLAKTIWGIDKSRSSREQGES